MVHPWSAGWKLSTGVRDLGLIWKKCGQGLKGKGAVFYGDKGLL